LTAQINLEFECTYAEAISRGLCTAMYQDEKVVVLGIGVQYPSGIFGTTNIAYSKFGAKRVIDTPAMENALTGIAVGLAEQGYRPLLVHARVDFMALSLDQIINVVSKWKYMFGGNAGNCPIVIRSIIGRGWGQGATHSQTFHSMLSNIPGLRVLLPATVQDAHDMLLTSFKQDIPTVIFEHRSLYTSRGKLNVEKQIETIQDFYPAVLREGKDVSLAGYSYAVSELMEVANSLSKIGISSEVIDLRSTFNVDLDCLVRSAEKTGYLLLHDVGWSKYGALAEVQAQVLQRSRRPIEVLRVGVAETPSPASEYLEGFFYPKVNHIAGYVLNLIGESEGIMGKISNTNQDSEFLGPY
jgi:pyruvate/2-oxoglutarate/acetoin dehydrogenase E1 component